ncbi:MAG: peptidoglycan-binding protein [Hyphomicrobiales bacterium]|nr:peptidoglycan-binding protein [Hyphomicrobiales bacterium]
MSLEIRKRLIQYFAANRRSSIFSFMLFGSICLVAANAVFNQPGNHPRPLWKSGTGLVTHTVSKKTNFYVPVRRVETTHYSAQKIPVPILRPSNTVSLRIPVEAVSKSIPVKTADVQRLLHQLGFYQGTVDGLMGPRTIKAVKKFEQSKGLPESGNISPALLLLLQSAVDRAAAKSSNGIGEVLNEQNSHKSRKKLTSDNVDQVDPVMITRIQVGLINYGSDDVTIDGVMGDHTKIAIEQFQARFNLEVDGTPSKALIRKLESVGALTKG